MAKSNMTDAELASFMKQLKSWFKTGDEKAAEKVTMRRGGKVKRKKRWRYADGGMAQPAVMPQPSSGGGSGPSPAVSAFRSHQGMAPGAGPMSAARGPGGGWGNMGGGMMGAGGGWASGGGNWASGIDPAAMAAAKAQMMAPRSAPVQAQATGLAPAAAQAAQKQWMMNGQPLPEGMGGLLQAFGFTGKNTPFGQGPVTQSGYKRGGRIGDIADQALRIARKK